MNPDTSLPGLIGLKTSCWCDLLISLSADAAKSQREDRETARYTESKHCQIWAWCLKLCSSLGRAVQQAKTMIRSSPWGAGVQIRATSWFTHTDCPLLLPRGWWHQQMEVSECCDPQRSIDTVCFNNPTRHSKMKTPPDRKIHFQFDTSAANIRKEKKAAMRLPLKSPSGAGVSEMVCMLILYLSAQTSYTWLFLPAPSTSFPFTFKSQITSSHSHLFPFQLLLPFLSFPFSSSTAISM